MEIEGLIPCLKNNTMDPGIAICAPVQSLVGHILRGYIPLLAERKGSATQPISNDIRSSDPEQDLFYECGDESRLQG